MIKEREETKQQKIERQKNQCFIWTFHTMLRMRPTTAATAAAAACRWRHKDTLKKIYAKYRRWKRKADIWQTTNESADDQVKVPNEQTHRECKQHEWWLDQSTAYEHLSLAVFSLPLSLSLVHTAHLIIAADAGLARPRTEWVKTIINARASFLLWTKHISSHCLTMRMLDLKRTFNWVNRHISSAQHTDIHAYPCDTYVACARDAVEKKIYTTMRGFNICLCFSLRLLHLHLLLLLLLLRRKKEILLFCRLQRHKNLKCKSTNERKIVANKIENDRNERFIHTFTCARDAATIQVMHNNVNAQCTCSTISNHVTAICIQWVCVAVRVSTGYTMTAVTMSFNIAPEPKDNENLNWLDCQCIACVWLCAAGWQLYVHRRFVRVQRSSIYSVLRFCYKYKI